MHLTQATTWKKRTPDAYTKHREAMQAPQRQTAARNKTLAGLTILLSSPEGTHLQSQWQNPHLAAPHPTPCVNSARCLSSDTLQSKEKGIQLCWAPRGGFPQRHSGQMLDQTGCLGNLLCGGIKEQDPHLEGTPLSI